MIHYFFENIDTFEIDEKTTNWIKFLIANENKKLGEINYILCDDEYLLGINKKYLNHDYYTDIITFDYVKGRTISGDIFISFSRIQENAFALSEGNQDLELHRVLAHGVLHLCGYKDKTEKDLKMMRAKENFYLSRL